MPYQLICYESKIIDSTRFFGRFKLGSFLPGEALTVANTLRRCLLSQLPGVSIGYAQFTDAIHEYSPIRGIQQLPLDILLNLKQIVLVSDFATFQPQVVFVNVMGPTIIQAKHFQWPFFIHCINPDQVIAHVNEAGRFQLKILVLSGKGTKHMVLDPNYVAELFQTPKSLYLNSSPAIYPSDFTHQQLVPNLFPVHGIFSPVVKVNYTIEFLQGGTTQENLREVIYLEIWTNGSIDPKDAIHEASTLLIDLFLPWQGKDLPKPKRFSHASSTETFRLPVARYFTQREKPFQGPSVPFQGPSVPLTTPRPKPITNPRYLNRGKRPFVVLFPLNDPPNTLKETKTKQSQRMRLQTRWSFDLDDMLSFIRSGTKETIFMPHQRQAYLQKAIMVDAQKQINQNIPSSTTQPSPGKVASSPALPMLPKNTNAHSSYLNASISSHGQDIDLYHLGLPKSIYLVLKSKGVSHLKHFAQVMAEIETQTGQHVNVKVKQNDSQSCKVVVCHLNTLAHELRRTYLNPYHIDLSIPDTKTLLTCFYRYQITNWRLFSAAEIEKYFNIVVKKDKEKGS